MLGMKRVTLAVSAAALALVLSGATSQAQTALKKYKARIIALESQREDIDAAIETLNQSIALTEKFLAKPATPAAMANARAFEEEAKKRLEEAD